ncbi:Transposase and inactivated derivatives [hydrothermal vent metagenome]|uniref:Transposase and inactivated derivatives n=3 Tax=hydrothermal vent metagenome TaxID=652676 RepID=A0A3B0XY93_9ZZZZ
MPKPRYAQVSLEATPYYHCFSRCVRRAFLCGLDGLTQTSYEHRKQWLEDRVYTASTAFALDLCTYAIMSNHYHVVLHVNKPQADAWDMDEIINRWHMLYKGNVLSQRYLKGESLGKAELATLNEKAELWREQLMDISWFMRFVNEGVARRANAEDDCTGRFWEGRFSSQALLDEAALAACMVYVDLNPVRAGMAKTPEASDHTSVKKRIQHALNIEPSDYQKLQPEGLYPFVGNPRIDMPDGLPFELSEYIELVDLTGKQLREGKHG